MGKIWNFLNLKWMKAPEGLIGGFTVRYIEVVKWYVDVSTAIGYVGILDSVVKKL